MTSRIYPPKTPGDRLDYYFDFGPALQRTDHIVSASAAAGSDGITVIASALVGNVACAYVSGGLADTVYLIEFVAQSAQGLVFDEFVKLPVTRPNPDAPPSPDDDGDDDGLLLRGQTFLADTWRLFVSGDPVTPGVNTGRNFAIQSYNDAGAFLANTLTINRATGAVAVSTESPRGDFSSNVATTAFVRNALGNIATFTPVDDGTLTIPSGVNVAYLLNSGYIANVTLELITPVNISPTEVYKLVIIGPYAPCGLYHYIGDTMYGPNVPFTTGPSFGGIFVGAGTGTLELYWCQAASGWVIIHWGSLGF